MTLTGPVVGELKRLGRRAGDKQATFHVPSTRAADFVAALLGQGAGKQGARVTIENVVFPPWHLRTALGHEDVSAGLASETTIEAGPGEAPALLTAALSDWTDFWFEPSPGAFLLYGHHDEYSTVYAHKQGAVSRVTTALTQAGFRHTGDRRTL